MNVPLTPEEIATKRFVTTWRGYDPHAVSAFLRRVADDYRALLEIVASQQRPSAAEEPRADGDTGAGSARVRAQAELTGDLIGTLNRTREMLREALDALASASEAAESLREMAQSPPPLLVNNP
jgi:DivIVA domain-containing protein